MKLTKVDIPSKNILLNGLIYAGEVSNGICAVLSHGYTASKESLDLLAGYLAKKGTPCITFDARGHKLGSSGGSLDSIQDVVLDLRNVIAFAETRFDCEQILLVGHSMGGIVSMAAAEGDIRDNGRVCGVVVIAAGPNPGAGFNSPVGEAMLTLRSDYVVGLKPIELLRQLGELVPSVDNLQSIPSLFVAARGDVLVKSSRLQEMAERAGPLHRFMEVDGSHLEAPDKARGVVGTWIQRQFFEAT